MDVCKQWSYLLAVWLLCIRLVPVQAQTTADDNVRAADKTLVTTVFSRLVATLHRPDRYKVWPPLVGIAPIQDVNAYATLLQPGSERSDDEAGIVWLRAGSGAVRTVSLPRKGGVATPVVVIYMDTLHKVVQGQPDRLAFILGHELGHIMKGHVLQQQVKGANAPLVQVHLSRENEFEADHQGMQIALAAGYPFSGVRNAVQKMIEMGVVFEGDSPIKGLAIDHPPWSERLAKLDVKNTDFWHAMSAFNDGAALLTAEQYRDAAVCFESVVNQFPDFPEAWANLGYAYLMQYCDQLDVSDIRNYGIGYIVCGGFFRRLKSSDIKKGISTDLWDKANFALTTALSKVKNDPDKAASLALIKSNLGLAYLVSSTGKPDHDNADRYLKEAAAAAQTAGGIDPQARMAIMLNAGVSELSAGQTDSGSRSLAAVDAIEKRFSGGSQAPVPTNSIDSALLYNRSLVAHTRSESGKEADLLEQFLSVTSSASLWYDEAYSRYQLACAGAHRTPLAKEKLIARANGSGYRPLLSVSYPDGVTVSLAQPTAKLDPKLGTPLRAPSVAGRTLSRWVYAERGLMLLTAEDVLAIQILSPQVQLPLVRSGVGGKRVGALKVGMKQDELLKLLGPSDRAPISLDDPAIVFRYYRNLGVAVHTDRGIVTALAVVQAPDTGS